MKVDITMAKQVQTQFQAHAIVTLIVGKLHKGDDLLQWLKRLVTPRLVTRAAGDLIQQLPQLSCRQGSREKGMQ
jgi:hypothetical protein